MVNKPKNKNKNKNKSTPAKRTGMAQLMAAYRANPPNRQVPRSNRRQISIGKTITMNANSVARNIRSSGRLFPCSDRERAGILRTNSSAFLNVPYTAEVGGGSPTSVFVFQVNPGLKTYWPRLATIASLYNEYRVKSVKIELVPVMSEYNLSGTTGRWIIAYNPDPADPLRISPTAMSVLPSVTGQITEGATFVVPASALDKGWHYVRKEGLGDASSITDYDLGNIFVATYGCADSVGNSHEVFVSYDIELRQPVLNDDAAGSCYDVLTDSRWLVNQTSPDLMSGTTYGFYEAPPSGLTSVKFNHGMLSGIFNGAVVAIDSSGMNENSSGAATLSDPNWSLPAGLYKVSGQISIQSASPISSVQFVANIAGGTQNRLIASAIPGGYGPTTAMHQFSSIINITGANQSLDFEFAVSTYTGVAYKLGSSGTYGVLPASWIHVETLSTY